MDKREKQIYKVLEKYTRVRFNRLKKIIVEEKELMSERPFRVTLKQLVENGLVKKIEIDKQHVEYTVDFNDIEYENETVDFFEKLISNYNKTLDDFIEKREKMSKIEQANIITTLLKSVYFTGFWFKEFAHARNNPKVRSLKVDFQNVQDLAESISVDEGRDVSENLNIYETVNKVMMSESFGMLNEINSNLAQIK
ncbi:MAG: hypothetical protein KGZ34_07135 [Nitrosarchaeum sp.]|nr:hypothetical protein [Nitrosarchaeum sp.]